LSTGPGNVLSHTQPLPLAGCRGKVYVESLEEGARFTVCGLTGVVRFHTPSSTAVQFLDQPIINDLTGKTTGTRKVKTTISSTTLVRKIK